MNMRRILLLLAGAVLAAGLSSCGPKNVRLLYWNIQNGMWADEGNNYDNFVDFVKQQAPDICVWCEAQTIYYTDTCVHRPKDELYLTDNWDELAARYGHGYVYVGGHRDNYPQVITSRLPIRNVRRLIGEKPDSVVSHGAGWAQIQVAGKTLNVVTLHTWPQRYTFGIKDPVEREESKARNEGDFYRRMEIEYICHHTLGSVEGAEKEYWMMMGDFNSISPLDNGTYNYPADTVAFLTQRYILENTPYVDAVRQMHPDAFQRTTMGQKRIDFVYLTQPLMDRVKRADVIYDGFAEQSKDPRPAIYFDHPSDHCPIVVDFKL